MSPIESICQSASSLSDVQIHILKNSEKLLQFASDLSHRKIYVYVPGQEAGTLVLTAQRRPFFQESDSLTALPDSGVVVTRYDEPIVWQVLTTGTPLKGTIETNYGQMEPISCYPFVDNGGLTIGVISFVGRIENSRDVLTETAFLSLQVPIEEHMNRLYQRLSLQDGIILVDGNGTICYVDDMAESIMQLRGRFKRLTGENIYSSQFHFAGVKQALETRQGSVVDVQHGKNVFTRRIIPILRRGRVDRIIVVITERTELYQKEEELMIKTSVIKEIHHRVKNNLQTIAGLLRMQLRRVQSEEAKEALNESLNRIISISLVHDTLSHHDEEYIDISDVAEKLLSLVLHSLVSTESHIIPVFHGQKLMMPSDAATSLSLVLNELITNSVLHGLSGRKEGIITLQICCQGETADITVEDNGCGMPETMTKDKRHHLGLKIIKTLVEKDLHGTIIFSGAEPEGTRAVIHFPIEKRGD